MTGPHLRWSKAEIIEALQQRRAAGKPLSRSRAKEDDARLVGAAIRYFGNWATALAAAEIHYTELKEESQSTRLGKISKWTREAVVEEIKRLNESEEDMRLSAMQKRYPGLCSATLKRYFRTWNEALASAGIDPEQAAQRAIAWRQRRRQWLKELVEEARGARARS